MLISKVIDSLVLAAPKKNDPGSYSYNLCSLQVNENRISATNGYSLYYYNVPDDNPKSDEFPGPNDTSLQDNEVFPVLLPKSLVEKAIRNRPKKPSISILNYTHLSVEQGVTGKKGITLLTTDLETFDKVSIKVNDDHCFPDVDRMISSVNDVRKEADYKTQVVLSVKELDLLVKVAKKQGVESVEASIAGNNDPIKVNVGDINAVIMPTDKQK